MKIWVGRMEQVFIKTTGINAFPPFCFCFWFRLVCIWQLEADVIGNDLLTILWEIPTHMYNKDRRFLAWVGGFPQFISFEVVRNFVEGKDRRSYNLYAIFVLVTFGISNRGCPLAPSPQFSQLFESSCKCVGTLTFICLNLRFYKGFQLFLLLHPFCPILVV